MTLVITGTLTNGCQFIGTDCLTYVPGQLQRGG